MTTATLERPAERVTMALPTLHQGQSAALREFVRHRFLVLFCGRQWGKSRFAATAAMGTAFKGGRVWWVAPSFPQSEEAWDLLVQMLAGKPGVRVNIAGRRITFPSRGYIRVRTADKPDSLRGATLDLVILDEAAFIPEMVWTDILRPALGVRNGKAIFATTPNGRNWMFDAFLRGQGDGDPDWHSMRFRTADNPFYPAADIDAAKTVLSPGKFAQEYEAEPSSGHDGIIPLDWITAAQERWKAGVATGGALVLGIDVAEGGGDRTIIAIRRGSRVDAIEDHTPQVVGDFSAVERRATELLTTGGGFAIVDAVGVGAMLPHTLRKLGLKVMPFKASYATQLRDVTGMFGFADTRSAAWWHMRTLLDPALGSTVELPPGRQLTAELSAPGYDVRAGAKIGLERKDEVVKRLGRSPDLADAVVMAFYDRNIMGGAG